MVAKRGPEGGREADEAGREWSALAAFTGNSFHGRGEVGYINLTVFPDGALCFLVGPAGASLLAGADVISKKDLTRFSEKFSTVKMTAMMDSKPDIVPSLVWSDSQDVRLRYFPILTPYDNYDGYITSEIKQLQTSPVTAGVLDPRMRTAAKAWAERTVNFLPERAGDEREHPKLKSNTWG
eukprot:jgi/Tetstr1/449929/TSEL_036983.t1